MYLLYASVFLPIAYEVLDLIVLSMNIRASSVPHRHSTQHTLGVNTLLESDILAFCLFLWRQVTVRDIEAWKPERFFI